MKTVVSVIIAVFVISGLALSGHAAEGTNFTGTYKGTQQLVNQWMRPVTREMILSVSDRLDLVATFYTIDTGYHDVGVIFDVKPEGDVLTFKMRYKSGGVAEYTLTLSGEAFNGKAYNIHAMKTSTISLTRVGILACPINQKTEKIVAPC